MKGSLKKLLTEKLVRMKQESLITPLKEEIAMFFEVKTFEEIENIIYAKDVVINLEKDNVIFVIFSYRFLNELIKFPSNLHYFEFRIKVKQKIETAYVVGDWVVPSPGSIVKKEKGFGLEKEIHYDGRALEIKRVGLDNISFANREPIRSTNYYFSLEPGPYGFLEEDLRKATRAEIQKAQFKLLFNQ